MPRSPNQLPQFPSLYCIPWHRIKGGWKGYQRGPWKWLNYRTLADAVGIEPYDLYVLLWYDKRVTRERLQPIADAMGWTLEVLVEELRKERARRWELRVRKMSKYELMGDW